MEQTERKVTMNNNGYETDPEFIECFEQFAFHEVPEEERQQVEAGICINQTV